MRMLVCAAVLACLGTPAEAQDLRRLEATQDSLEARIAELEAELTATKSRLMGVRTKWNGLIAQQEQTVGDSYGVMKMGGTVFSSVGGEGIGYASMGDTLEVTGHQGDFYKVRFAGKDGFVSEVFLEPSRFVVSMREQKRKEQQRAEEAAEQARQEQLAAQQAERQRQDAAAYQVQYEKRLPFVIQRVWTGNPNAADGVSMHLAFLPTNRKTIKYIRANVTAYNEVGDRVLGRHNDSYSRPLNITGPLEVAEYPVEVESFYWENLWYNSTITCARMTRLEVEYMDGTRGIYVRDLPQLYAEGFSNDCSYEAQKR